MPIDDLIGDVEGFDPVALDALDRDDIADALARALDPDDPNQAGALQLLALVDPASALQAAGQLVADGVDSMLLAVAVRAAAAAEDDAVPFASALATSTDDAVALAAWVTLAQTASSDDLDVLQALAEQTWGVVREQAFFALSVIAYRAGLTGFEVPFPSRLLDVDIMLPLLSIDSRRVDDEDFALLSRMPRWERYKVGLRQENTLAIDCGDDHMLLATDADFVGGLLDVLMPLPSLAGIVALRDPFRASYSVRYLILTWPEGDDRLHVAVHQAGGAQVYFGTAAVGDGEATLALRCVEQPGAVPIQLTAAISAGLAFTEAFSAEFVDGSTPKLDLDPDPDA